MWWKGCVNWCNGNNHVAICQCIKSTHWIPDTYTKSYAMTSQKLGKKQVLSCFYNWYSEEFHLSHNKEYLPIMRPLNYELVLPRELQKSPNRFFKILTVYFGGKNCLESLNCCYILVCKYKYIYERESIYKYTWERENFSLSHIHACFF